MCRFESEAVSDRLKINQNGLFLSQSGTPLAYQSETPNEPSHWLTGKRSKHEELSQVHYSLIDLWRIAFCKPGFSRWQSQWRPTSKDVEQEQHRHVWPSPQQQTRWRRQLLKPLQNQTRGLQLGDATTNSRLKK